MAPLRILAGIAFVAACGGGDIGDPSALNDASLSGAPDAGPGTPDAQPGTPDARTPDAAPPPDAQPCDDGDLNVVDPVTGRCYMYFAAEVPWAIALGACAALPGDVHLATITTAAENAVIAALNAGQEDSWLGGTDTGVEGTWIWISGEPFVFDNWREGEPNNGNTNGPENCMVIEIDALAEWDDRGCDRVYSYMCERE